MQSHALTLLFPLILVAYAVAAACCWRNDTRRSRLGTPLAILPAVVMLGLFYSLALHMHHALGGWPSTIGEAGFPPALIAHADVAAACFAILLLVCMLAWPVLLVMCLLVRPWRGFVYYLAVYAVSCVLCLGLMLLAPAKFLNWWWD